MPALLPLLYGAGALGAGLGGSLLAEKYGKDKAAKALQRKLAQEQYAVKRAKGMISESEDVRQSRKKLESGYLDRLGEDLDLLSILSGSGMGGFEDAAGDPRRVEALLDAQSGVPGLGSRVREASAVQLPAMYGVMGISPESLARTV